MSQSNRDKRLFLRCVCKVCLKSYFDTNAFNIKSATDWDSPELPSKDLCMYCQRRYGYDYYIFPRNENKKEVKHDNAK